MRKVLPSLFIDGGLSAPPLSKRTCRANNVQTEIPSNLSLRHAGISVACALFYELVIRVDTVISEKGGELQMFSKYPS